MINTCQTALVEADYTEPFEDRVDILFRELELATKWQCPSLLLAIYSSEFVHGDAEVALENRLLDLGQKAHHIVVKSQDDSDIPLLISELADLSNAVVFVEGLRWGCGEADFNSYRVLNKHREFFIENRIRVVFWLTETEAIHLAHHAPDYWTFRHRVIEFVDSPRPEQIPSQALESAWQGSGDFTGSGEDLEAKITLRTALLTDLPDGDESTAARANLLLTLGILHWRRGDYDQAAQFLHTAIEHASNLKDNPFEALCYNALALVETALGRNREAIKAYQRALELAPGKIAPWNNLGNLHYKLAQYEEALAAFQKAVGENPSDMVSWAGLGDTNYKLGRHEDAIYAYRKNLELTPNNAHSWSSLGEVYAEEGQLDEAFAAYQKALGIDRHISVAWVGLGDVYRLQGSAENAILAYQTAIEIDPANGRAWNELGDIHNKAGDSAEAVRAYQKAIELDRGCGQPYTNLASIHLHDGDYASAIPLLRKGVELQAEPAEAAILWNRLGDAYRKLDDYDNAIAAYRKADELETGVSPAIQPEAGPVPLAPTKEAAADLDAEPELENGPAELEHPEPAAATDNAPIALSEAGPAPDLAVTPEDASITLPAEPETEPAEPQSIELAGPEAGQLIDDSETMADESEVDFAKWLEGLVVKLPLPADPEEASAPAITPVEAEQSQEFSAFSDLLSSRLKAGQAGEPEVDSLEFEPALNSPAIEPDEMNSAQPEAGEPVLIEATPVTTLLEEAQTPGIPTVVETVAVDPAPEPAQDQAEIPADAGTKVDPKGAQIWNELGNIYYNIVAYDEAINALNKAIELDHSYGWTYNNLASIYIHKGSYAEAIPLLKQGIHLLSEAKDKALLWNRLGDAYRRMDQSDQAAAAYQKAMELDPDNVSLLTRARFSLLGNCRASSQ